MMIPNVSLLTHSKKIFDLDMTEKKIQKNLL